MKPFITLSLFLFSILSLKAGENIYLELSLNGTAIEGEPSVASFGGVDVSDMIECHAFSHDVKSPLDRNGSSTGRTQLNPIRIVRRVDKASPLLYQGLFQSQPGTATFRFFRQDISGAVSVFQTITLNNLRVIGVRRWQPNNLEPAGASLPLMEEVVFAYEEITITDSGTGASATGSLTPR